MISVNQDFLVTTGIAIVAAGAKGVLGMMFGPAGIGAGKLVDTATTGTSIYYDYNRVYGSTPNYITVGISVSHDKTFGNAVIICWDQP